MVLNKGFWVLCLAFYFFGCTEPERNNIYDQLGSNYDPDIVGKSSSDFVSSVSAKSSSSSVVSSSSSILLSSSFAILSSSSVKSSSSVGSSQSSSMPSSSSSTPAMSSAGSDSGNCAGFGNMCLWTSGNCYPVPSSDGISVADCIRDGWLFQGGKEGESTMCAGGTWTGCGKNSDPFALSKGCCRWNELTQCYNVYTDEDVINCNSGDNHFWSTPCPNTQGSCP